jgi:hypothetical protein
MDGTQKIDSAEFFFTETLKKIKCPISGRNMGVVFSVSYG